MKIVKIAPMLLCAGLLLSACSSLYEPKPQLTQVGNETVISNTASLSHIISYDFSKDSRSCAHPAPDAAFDQGESSGFSISLVSFGGGTDAGKQADNSAEVEMAGRTPAVLITRELFYRLCEFSKNQQLDKAEAKDLYVQTLGAIKNVWAIEAGKTTVKIGETAASNQITNVSTLPVVGALATGAAPTKASATTEDSCTTAGGSWDSTATPPCS
jgi:hypothetical protein